MLKLQKKIRKKNNTILLENSKIKCQPPNNVKQLESWLRMGQINLQPVGCSHVLRSSQSSFGIE